MASGSFLWVCAKRSKRLPEGGSLREHEVKAFVKLLEPAVGFGRSVSRLVRDEAARDEWRRIYYEVTEDVAGLLGAVTARAEAHVLRLTNVYAQLNSSDTIGVDHLRRAHALWHYCEDSARVIFGNATGDRTADELLKAVIDAAERGETISRTDFQALGSGHLTAAQIDAAETLLVRKGKVNV